MNSWSIGIKSGIITLLALMLYGLIIQVGGFTYSILGNLEYILLILGIYSSHHFYKSANGGIMSYGQGIKLGLIVMLFIGSITGIVNYVYVRFIDPDLLTTLANKMQEMLQNKGLDKASIEETMRQLKSYLTPKSIALLTPLIVVAIGFVLTLIIALFSKSKPKTTGPDEQA